MTTTFPSTNTPAWLGRDRAQLVERAHLAYRKADMLDQPKAGGHVTVINGDPRFDQVNSYHESVLDKALKVLYGGL